MKRIAIITILAVFCLAAALRWAARRGTIPQAPKASPFAAVGHRQGGSQRPVYPYSVVPGGVQSAAEAVDRVRHDPAVANHYAPIRLAQLKPVVIEDTKMVYVSYRKKGTIYWTARPVALRAGETVLSDGDQQIRARCGNRISEIAQAPVEPESEAPTEAELDTPLATPAEALASLSAGSENPLARVVEEGGLPPLLAGTTVPSLIGPLGDRPNPLPTAWMPGSTVPFIPPPGIVGSAGGAISVPSPPPDISAQPPLPPVDLLPPGLPPVELPPSAPPVFLPPGNTPPSSPPPSSIPPNSPPALEPPATPPVTPPQEVPPETPNPPGNPPVPPPVCVYDCGTSTPPGTPPDAEVPEPGTLLLIAVGVGALALSRPAAARRR